MLSFNSKHSTIESLLKDLDYCKWLMTTTWFKNKKEYNLVKKLLEPKQLEEKPKKSLLPPLDTDIIETGKYKDKEYGYIKQLVKDRNFVYYDNLTNVNRSYGFSCSSSYYTQIKNIESYIYYCSKFKSKLGKYCQYIMTTEEYKDLIDYSISEYQYKFKFKNKKIDLEELTKEAFKPSRINYILSLDPEYEF